MRNIVVEHKSFLSLTDSEQKIDPHRVQQVLINLLSNAIKFSYNNSKIEITSILEFDMLKISVADKGIGISEVNIKRLF